MIKTREDISELVTEICAVCDDTRVRVEEVGWFVLELDRHDELRGGDLRGGTHSDGEFYEDEPGLEFRCLSCGASWA